jgi:hypothetical protein
MGEYISSQLLLFTSGWWADDFGTLSGAWVTLPTFTAPTYGGESKAWSIESPPFDDNHTQASLGMQSITPSFTAVHMMP